jgi:hypothetical protein
MKNKQNIIDDKKNPVMDCMLVEKCTNPLIVRPRTGSDVVWTFVFYQHLNPNGFVPFVIYYLFFVIKQMTIRIIAYK